MEKAEDRLILGVLVLIELINENQFEKGVTPKNYIEESKRRLAEECRKELIKYDPQFVEEVMVNSAALIQSINARRGWLSYLYFSSYVSEKVGKMLPKICERINSDLKTYFTVVEKNPLAENANYQIFAPYKECGRGKYEPKNYELSINARTRKVILQKVREGVRLIDSLVKKHPRCTIELSNDELFFTYYGKEELMNRYANFSLPTQYYSHSFKDFKEIISTTEEIRFSAKTIPFGLNGSLMIFCYCYLQLYYVQRLNDRIFGTPLMLSFTYARQSYGLDCRVMSTEQTLHFGNELKRLNLVADSVTVPQTALLMGIQYGITDDSHWRRSRVEVLRSVGLNSIAKINWIGTLHDLAILSFYLKHFGFILSNKGVYKLIIDRMILHNGRDINLRSFRQTMSNVRALKVEIDADSLYLEPISINDRYLYNLILNFANRK
jgi:hypothetical protein